MSDHTDSQLATLIALRDEVTDSAKRAALDAAITAFQRQATPAPSASQQQQAGGNITNSPQRVQHDASTHGKATTQDNLGLNIGVSTGPVIFTQNGQPTPQLLDQIANALRSKQSELIYQQAYRRTHTIEEPYQFLRPFELQDTSMFHGRDDEIDQVYNLQQRHRLAVLHAPSGTGKTSLLQAGLMPRLLKEQCLPIYVRAGTRPMQTLYERLLPMDEDLAKALSEKPCAEVLRALQTALEKVSLRRLVIIFDQFEELFAGTTHEAPQLVDAMKEVSEHDFNVSLLVSIRDDYLSLLGGYFNSAIPSILNNQQRLEMMGRKQAERAITRPLVDLKPSCSYAPDLLPVLLSDLAAGYDTGVALPHLQIVCTELYKLYRRQVANEGSITLQLYDQAGRAAGILSNYLIERMRQLGHRAELARAVLKELVSSEAIRRQVSEVSLHQCYTHQAHDMREVLRILVDQRILRRLEDDEGSVYEVAHEYLIQEVRQWLHDSDFEAKRARDMLKREVESYRSYGMLIPHNRLAILAEHRTHLQIDNLDADLAKQPTQLQIDNLDAVACVTLSVYQESITQQLAPLITEDITQWVAPLAAMKSLAWALHSQHAEVRHAAVEILGKAAETLDELDYPQAVDTLMHALHHGIDVKIRCTAAEILGKFGDPRFPTTVDEWQEKLMQRTEAFGASDGYWCYVQPGTYCIGGWEGSKESAAIELSGFWVARYPITVAQYQTFIEAGGYQLQDYWTPEGWKWKEEWEEREKRTQPLYWGEAHFNNPNQAVVGVTWYESIAFCTWLNAQLTDQLPKGYALYLPTEAEWEVAAAYDAQMQRRNYPWGEDEPTLEHAIFEDDQGNNLGAPAPVGVCPAGAAACGALDMGGNVWEWSQSSRTTYPHRAGTRQADFQRDEYDVPLRGGSWYLEGKRVSCAARYSEGPLNSGSNECGFRVLLSSTSPTTASRLTDNIREMVDTGAE